MLATEQPQTGWGRPGRVFCTDDEIAADYRAGKSVRSICKDRRTGWDRVDEIVGRLGIRRATYGKRARRAADVSETPCPVKAPVFNDSIKNQIAIQPTEIARADVARVRAAMAKVMGLSPAEIDACFAKAAKIV